MRDKRITVLILELLNDVIIFDAKKISLPQFCHSALTAAATHSAAVCLALFVTINPLNNIWLQFPRPSIYKFEFLFWSMAISDHTLIYAAII